MSDSEEETSAWRKSDLNRKSQSPCREINKRQITKDLSNEPEAKRFRKNDVIVEQRAAPKMNLDDGQDLLTQPPMLLFKHFLNQQENDILVEDAMRKYSEYKETFACQQLQSFFESHKDEEWFMEKYHPDNVESREKIRLESVEARRKVFMELFEDDWMKSLPAHVSYQDSLTKLLDAVCILLEGGNKNDLKALEKRVLRSESPEKVEIKMDTKTMSTGFNKHDFDNLDSDIELIEDTDNSNSLSRRRKQKKSEVIANVNVPNIKAEQPEEVDVSIEDMDNDKEVGDEPRSLHKHCSIFLRYIHASVFRSQIEELVKNTPGYMRLALQEAMPERKFFRRGWLTFERNTDIKNVAWNLSKARLLDVDLGAMINKDILQRIRPVSPLTNHRAVMRQDVKYAAKLVSRFDKRRHLWESVEGGNPLLRNITEHLVDEGSYEEEAYLGGDINNDLVITGGGDPSNIRIEEDLILAEVVDRLILYLRIVHSYDYYVATEYMLEDQLPTKCGLMHARGCLRYPDQRFHQAEIEDHMKRHATHTDLVLDSIENLDMEVAARLGVKSVEEAVEKFLNDNTKEISTEKWLCPLSGKKFKGPDFVHKHIMNKFGDRIENVKQTVKYFNNYILDPRRPQLPEHKSNRPPSTLDKPLNNRTNNHGDLRGHYTRGENRRSTGGNYYKKSYENQDKDDFNNAGSYYSRKIMSYNDVTV